MKGERYLDKQKATMDEQQTAKCLFGQLLDDSAVDSAAEFENCTPP